jgi:hypothetical protein
LSSTTSLLYLKKKKLRGLFELVQRIQYCKHEASRAILTLLIGPEIQSLAKGLSFFRFESAALFFSRILISSIIKK